MWQPGWEGNLGENGYLYIHKRGLPSGSVGKDSTCKAGDLGSIPGLGRSPVEGNDNPLQYSSLENSMYRGARQNHHDVQAAFRKGRGTRHQIANIHCVREKAREFQKEYLLLSYWLHQSLCVDTTNWKILQEMGVPGCLTCLLRNMNEGQEAS